MPKFRRLCIVGTDTDVGKTVVTAALARAMGHAGRAPLVLKPVQTGYAHDVFGSPLAPDCVVYREACSDAIVPDMLLLEDACSPHLAARQAGVVLSAAALAGAVDEQACARARPALIEGAGGLLTPLNGTETLLDAFALLYAPFILVAANRLGVLNHALLSVELLRARGLPLLGFILTNPAPEGGGALGQRIRADNRETLARMSGLPCLAELPYLSGLHSPDPAERLQDWERAARILADSVVVSGRAPQSAGDVAFREGFLPLNQPGESMSFVPPCVSPAELLRVDRDHVWHPYASAVRPMRAREAVGTEGARIVLRGGERLIDGMASWWCAVHGYRHPTLMRALAEQAEKMPHVMFGGLTHEPAVALAQRLLAMAPAGLDRVFFSDSGSVAVEVAIKMAVQYQRAAGCPERSRLLTVRGGYHGDTLGAMSVCDPETGMHADFYGILPRQIFAPRPTCRFDAEYDPTSAKAFETLLRAHAGEVAAVILEPVVQGAGGMWMYHPEYLRRVRELCRENGCLLILDEIATGFGRTGRMFACEWAGIAPDILCLGKALTGGVMSLAATLATREVAEGISRQGGVLMHGPTFMGNPLACAVAGASLDLLSSGQWKENVGRIEIALRQGLEPCRSLPGVADVRVLGAIGVLEMERPVAVEKLQDYVIGAHGVWLRPFGRLIYAMPPYVIADGEVRQLTLAMRGAIEENQWE